ncbi:MAG: glycosyltransferase [Acidimicrobiales bacterium]
MRFRRLRLLASVARGRPMWVQQFWCRAIGDAIAQTVRSFEPEVVQVELAVMGPALAAVPAGSARLVFVDYDPAFAIALDRVRSHHGTLRLLHMLDAAAWWWTERSALRRADVAVVFTERDRRQLTRMAGRTPIHIIPLATDLSTEPLDPAGDDGFVLFVGSAQHPPNVEAADRLASEILPRVVRQVPSATLHIVGDHQLAALDRTFAERCVVEGWVPDVVPLLDRAAVVVAPLRLGGGMRVKVVEALAAGKAVVASSVAVAGMDVEAAGAAIVVDDDEAFSNAVVGLLRNRSERVALAARARSWAIAHLDWSERVTAYEAVWTAAAGPLQTPSDLVRRLSWRFLLPLPPSGGFERLVVLGAKDALRASATFLGVAHSVDTMLDSSRPADVVAVLADSGGSDVKEVVASLRPGGVLYWEVDRRRAGQRLRTPRRLAAELHALGLTTVATYALRPDPERSELHLPVDHAGGIEWYLSSAYNAVSARQRLAEAATRLAARLDHRLLATFAPFHATIAVWTPLAAQQFTIAARAAHLGLAPAPTRSPLLINQSANRAILVTFTNEENERDSVPAAILKIPTRPSFARRTEWEQQITRQVRAALPEHDAEAIPSPYGLVDVGLPWMAGIERAASGCSLARSSGRWGRPLRAKVADLELAANWIEQLHTRYEITGQTWDERICTNEVDAVLTRFQQAFGCTEGEHRLFSNARRVARDLQGTPLPLVWQHGDFTVWNTLRDRSELRVLDWEGARTGLPLCDILRFVTHWHEVVLGARTLDSRLAAFSQLYCGARSQTRATVEARTTLDRYARSLALHPNCEPVLLVTSWAELALRRLDQRIDSGGDVDDPRGQNEAIHYIGQLAEALRWP